MHASSSNMSKELKNDIEILLGQAVFWVVDQNSKKSVLINYWRIAWAT